MNLHVIRNLLLPVGLAVLLSSCGKGPQAPAAATIISNHDLVLMLETTGSGFQSHTVINDSNYMAVDPNWMDSRFPWEFKNFMYEYSGPRKEESNDCDDFARAAAFYAQAASSRSHTLPLAFGEYIYTKDDGTGHVVNIVIVDASPTPKIIFWDATISSKVILSKAEMKSCSLRLF